jgi:hypothetical protein
MTRHVEIRPNYLADTNFLLRLLRAIEIDKKEPADWQRETIIKINELVALLSEASKRKIQRELNDT